MSVIALKEQAPSQIVDVALLPKEWEAYPEGARAKAILIWPTESPYTFCTPSWLYMFKTSRKTFPEQFWIEIFAYQLGCLVGVPVPPAFVAYDSKENIAGALIEWFYNEDEDSYLRGGDVMQAMITEYDIKKGLQHNLKTIFDFLKPLKWGTPHWTKEWAKILIFDALIGNTDRHQGNWGIITKYKPLDENSRTNTEILESKMSPAFDNGTSMGHEIFERNFYKYDNKKLEKYIDNGKPHLMWDLNQERSKHDNQENFIKKMAQAYPNCKDDMISCLQFSENQVKEIFQRLTSFDIQPGLSSGRAQFMLDLLLLRQKKLLLALDN